MASTQFRESLRESILEFRFSRDSGHGCNSESYSKNAPKFQELLREWPLHSENVFFCWGGGVFPGFWLFGNFSLSLSLSSFLFFFLLSLSHNFFVVPFSVLITIAWKIAWLTAPVLNPLDAYSWRTAHTVSHSAQPENSWKRRRVSWVKFWENSQNTYIQKTAKMSEKLPKYPHKNSCFGCFGCFSSHSAACLPGILPGRTRHLFRLCSSFRCCQCRALGTSLFCTSQSRSQNEQSTAAETAASCRLVKTFARYMGYLGLTLKKSENEFLGPCGLGAQNVWNRAEIWLFLFLEPKILTLFFTFGFPAPRSPKNSLSYLFSTLSPKPYSPLGQKLSQWL